MIIVRVLKAFQFQGTKFDANTIVGFPEKDKYDINALIANGYAEIVQQPTQKIERIEKKTDEATFQTEIYTLLLQKKRNEATELLATALEEKTKFYATRFDEKNEMYYYEEGIYRPNGRSYIKEFCRATLGDIYTEQLANQVCAKIEASNYIEQDFLLQRHYKNKVCCQNGILNLQTRELTPFNPETIFLAKTPLIYDPQAKCPAIDNFFSQILPEENDVKTMHEFFGYCLLGGYPIQKIALLIGEGGNGKGETIRLLQAFLGVKNYTGIKLQTLNDKEFKTSELFNKFANIGAEISDYPLKDTSTLKLLSGGESFSAGRKFKNDITFQNEAKLLFSANKLPKTYDLTEAFWRRWLYIVFPYKFVPKKMWEKNPQEKRKANEKLAEPNIIEKMINESELSGLLNLALDGLERLLNAGDFTSSTTQEETKEWWIRNSDSFLAFCTEYIEECEDGCISKKDLRSKYGKYCRIHKAPAEGDKHIHEVMTRQLRAWENQNSDTGERQWNGISFLNISFKKNEELSLLTKKQIKNEKIEEK